ncbi:MAG TPA: hypothetical protein VGI58_17780 [Streptosporangiaceae bacterium]
MNSLARPWKSTKDGRTIFRRIAPLVIWWIWVAFVIFNLGDVIIPHHDYFGLELLAGLLAVTGVAYACTLRPVVVTDDENVLVRNPIWDHRVPWAVVKGVFLGDSVELSCARPAPLKDKTIYCWALYTGRRSAMRAQFQRSILRPDQQFSRRAPASAPDPPRQETVKLMAQEIGRRATAARKEVAEHEQGTNEQGTNEQAIEAVWVQSRWAWLPTAGFVLPTLVLLVLLLAR